MLTRRQLLLRSPAALLAAGLWPGALAAGDKETDSFSFLVVNDLHSLNEKCRPWFEKVARQMAAHSEKPVLLTIAGDLSDEAKPEPLAAAKDIFASLKLPVHVVPGNHDYTPKQERKAYDDLFPKQLNHAFDHGGWQFVALDTTEGTKASGTVIAADTLNWLDANLPKLDKKKPTVIVTHFPLGEGVKMRPNNANDLLKRFLEFNLRAVYSGHFHSFTEKKAGDTVLTTNKCCSFARGNHDGTKEKGYFLVAAKDGKLERQFVEVKG
jgi:Icc-related predicted phosphoesterase